VNKGKSKDKGKSGAKAADKGKNGDGGVVYDYHDSSVHDFALRAQVLRGYEEFKVCDGIALRARGSRSPIAHPWILHIYSKDTGPAGTGAATREVLHDMGVEMGYTGGFGVWQLLWCVQRRPSLVPNAELID
jgi:hypothetical protein